MIQRVVVDKLIIVNRSLYISRQEIVAGFADRRSVLVDTQCNLIHADGWREAKGKGFILDLISCIYKKKRVFYSGKDIASQML